MRSVILFFMLSPTGSTSLGALCSMGDSTLSRPMSPGGMFPSYATMQLCMVFPI